MALRLQLELEDYKLLRLIQGDKSTNFGPTKPRGE